MPTSAHLAAALALATGAVAAVAQQPSIEVPVVDGAAWTVARNPDLGRYTSERQQPVDFAIWQAADGTWQLWSCIRFTNCGGNTRLFHRWEGRRLSDRDWKPMGIAMEADPALGETPGGLQAPHVIAVDGVFHMFYGDSGRICHATSRDGKQFERVRNADGEPALFAGPYGNTRDPMVLEVAGLYHCYYTGHQTEAPAGQWTAAVFCRTSKDLVHWSEPIVVAAGGGAAKYGAPATNAECPFVVARNGTYYLFRNVVYGADARNVQYASPNPFDFGVDDDRCFCSHLGVAAPEVIVHKGQYYLASLRPTLDGIQIAKLAWRKP